MDPLTLIQAIFAGFGFYAGITHLMIGLRSRPRNKVHLSFAILSFFFALDNIFLVFLNAAILSGSAELIVSINRWDLLFLYLIYASLYWFITYYSGVKTRLVPLIISASYIVIALSNFLFPFPGTWIYSSLEVVGDAFQVSEDVGLAIEFNPWYRPEVLVTLLLLIIYAAYCILHQYRRGERNDAIVLAISVGVFLATYCWDVFLVEYGLVPAILFTQNGLLAFLIIMSLRLSSQTVRAERELRQLNIELEDRVKERTAELSTAKESAEGAVIELKESESRLDYVLRSGQLAVWEYNLQKLETKVTEAFPYLLGYDPDDILVKSNEKWRGYELGHQSLAAQLLNEEDKERYGANLGEMIAGKETFEVEYRLRMVDGQFHWMRDHGKIVKWDEEGKPLLAYGVVMDIDDMKRLQLELIDARDVAEAANRAKSVFLANMNHELRTPLNAILGFAQLMERDPETTPRQIEQLETINSSGEHLLDLINDVLEMSKIEAGRIELDINSFDLFQTLASLESILRERAAKKGLEFVFEIGPDVPQYIRSDEGKLRQVLFNLLGNAIKFTNKGQVVLRADNEQANGGQSVHFEVKDTGVGIDEAEVNRLFEPFSQTQSGLQVSGGSGLGLPISLRYVQLLDGDISAQSVPGQGSVFAFDIRYETADPQEISPDKPTQNVIGLAPDQPDYRILVVDDSTENRHLLQQMLERVGFEVHTANDGEQAVTEYEAWHPHLIWMDIRMPVMDGYEATRQIKASEGGDTVVIAVTASAFEEDRAEILAAGCDDFVRKPFREGHIFETMAKFLDVEYVYKTAEAGTSESDEVLLTAEDMASFSREWLQALGQAARRGRTKELLELIAQIETEHPAEATALRAMVDELAFKEIIALTEIKESNEQPPS